LQFFFLNKRNLTNRFLGLSPLGNYALSLQVPQAPLFAAHIKLPLETLICSLMIDFQPF
jgi:hypothetical protein